MSTAIRHDVMYPAHQTETCPMCRLPAVLAEVGDEVQRAMLKFGPIASPHEGYAVILEELDELWDEVKANRGRTDDAFAEAKQVAAMGIRYMLDLSRWSDDR